MMGNSKSIYYSSKCQHLSHRVLCRTKTLHTDKQALHFSQFFNSGFFWHKICILFFFCKKNRMYGGRYFFLYWGRFYVVVCAVTYFHDLINAGISNISITVVVVCDNFVFSLVNEILDKFLFCFYILVSFVFLSFPRLYKFSC